jgi:hypothetical protein
MSTFWRILGIAVKVIPILAVLVFFWFYLPSNDVVRIVDTDVKRMDRTVTRTDSATGDKVTQEISRDVRFINAVWPDDEPRVYRNEETGWGFPWYFKFDSGNLQTEAQNLRSTREDPRWVRVTHYGWRIEILDMFPNVIALRQVDSPDYWAIPWIQIVVLIFFGMILFAIWYAWRWFVEIHWKPFMRRLHADTRFEDGPNAASQISRWTKANLRELGKR